MKKTLGCKICCTFLFILLAALTTFILYSYFDSKNKQDRPINFVKIRFDIKGLHIGDGLEDLIKNNLIYDFNKDFFQQKIKNDKYFECVRKNNSSKSDSHPYLDCTKDKYSERTWLSFNIEIVEQMPEEVYFEFDSEKLAKAIISFEPEYFDIVVKAALLKYGEPTNVSSQTLHNKLTGTESQDITITYENKTDNTTFILMNHKLKGNSYLPQGKIIMYSNAYLDAINKNSKPAEKDL